MNSSNPFSPKTTTPDEIVRQLKHLPSAPRVLPRLKQLLSDGNSSIDEVVRLVKLDPGIAGRVLQIGNSIYYSQGLRCYTVEEAVNRVGFDQVYEAVAIAVASEVLVRPLAVYELDADELWRRSIACALAAEALALHLDADRDVAYTIGLLHSVGMVAIDEWAFRNIPQLRLVSEGPPLEACVAERNALGFHQAEVGAALLRLWEFPAVMSEPVRWQYLPRGTSAHLRYASLLHVAKWLRSAACDVLASPPMPDATLLRALRLSPGRLEDLAGQVRSRLLSVDSMLDVRPSDTNSISFPGGERQIAGFCTGRSRPPV